MSGRPKTPEEFHQLVRRLARTRRSKPVGTAASPALEAVRFRSSPSLAFSPIAAGPVRPPNSRRKEEDSRPVVPVRFLGLFGTSANLPWHYTELVLQRAALRDRSFVDFVDLFLQQRPVGFLHAAWRKYRLPFSLEEHARTGELGEVEHMFRAIVGLGTPGLADRVPEGASPWIHFAGHFARGVRSADGLEALLEAALGHRVEVQQFVGRWREIGVSQRTRLGSEHGGAFHRLGQEAVLGSRTWDVQSTVRVLVGPLTMEERERLERGRFGLAGLRGLLRSYLGPDVEPELVFPSASHLDPGDPAHGAGGRRIGSRRVELARRVAGPLVPGRGAGLGWTGSRDRDTIRGPRGAVLSERPDRMAPLKLDPDPTG